MTDEPSSQSTAFDRGLIAELGKKTGVSWVRYDGVTHAVWHLWYDGALCLVSGGEEQPLPGIESTPEVEVTMRSKENGGRLVTWVGAVSVVRPEDEGWDEITAALVADRLNLDDLATAAAEWARSSTVTRIVPTDRTVERPGELSDDAHLLAPRETSATTSGALPRILHRRVKRRPRLS